MIDHQSGHDGLQPATLAGFYLEHGGILLLHERNCNSLSIVWYNVLRKHEPVTKVIWAGKVYTTAGQCSAAAHCS